MSSVACADIAVSAGAGSTAGLEHVLFNGAGAFAGPGEQLTGRTETTDNLVDVLDNGADELIADTSVLAFVESDTDDPFGEDTISILPNNNSFTFTVITFNLSVIEDGEVTIAGLDQNGDASGPDNEQTLPVTDNGDNFFRLDATNGQLITHVEITTDGELLTRIDEIRIGGISGGTPPPPDPPPPPPQPGPPPANPVPEPGSLAIWGVLGAVGAWRMRRQRARPVASSSFA